LKVVTACIVVASMCAPALAQQPTSLEREVWRSRTPAYDSCEKKASGVLRAIVDCEAQEFDIQDAKLNRTYRKVIAAIPRARETKLRAAQRSWIRRRDPLCKAAALRQDGSIHTWMYSYLYWSCVTDATIRRTILIERYAAGQASLADLVTDHRS
jgi:uncharacterized protein YecT (DUF1311 family)